MPARRLPPDHPAWRLEARYLAAGVVNMVCTLSPRRVIMGGGVMEQSQLFAMIREEVCGLLNGYVAGPEIGPPALGKDAGVLGAIALAMSE
jgi:fructokinase